MPESTEGESESEVCPWAKPVCVSMLYEQWQCVTPWMLSLRLSAWGFEEINKRSYNSEVLALWWLLLVLAQSAGDYKLCLCVEGL